MFDLSVDRLNGVGKTRAAALEKLGVKTIGELIHFLPRDYMDFSRESRANSLQQGELAALSLELVSEPRLVYPSRGLSLVTASAQDESGRIELVWFNQPYRKNALKMGQRRIFCGRADRARGTKLINPAVTDALPGILPVYPLVRGLTQNHMRAMVRQALRLALDTVEDDLHVDFCAQHGLIPAREALVSVHFPENMERLKEARHRLSFENMLYYLLAIALLKRERADTPGISFQARDARAVFLKNLPFAPTAAQMRAMDDIEADMRVTRPMNRLIQGDVGAGKTVLAFFAMHIAAQNGYQSVLMAPTELIARQHYALLQKTYHDDAVLLYGGMRKSEKDAVYARIREGSARFVVGTHALIQPTLAFFKLGLVVTDEQHRFGVRQRAQIADKADIVPDVLVMSATPIPRTLAMLLYGDLDISVVDELPPGRKPVLTRLVPEEKRMDMYRFITRMIEQGRQAYIVCPLVEKSEILEARSAEQVYAELVAALPGVRFGLLHGRMASAKKDEMITAFRNGDIHALVSTTVVEVGVDVPNAAVMAIEDAQRFGLAQLHQLRGRVGRGAAQSFCFLLNRAGGAALERIRIMTETNDGFYIAKKDLELRGPGEFMGTRQHGEDGLYAMRAAADMHVLLQAQLAADALIKEGEKDSTRGIFARARALYILRMREIVNN